jgi:6-phosphogluconolactonase
LGKYLCEILPNIETEWDKWIIFFCDERFVTEEDADSTYGCVFLSNQINSSTHILIVAFVHRFYKANLIPKVPLKAEQFMWINVNDSIEKVADDYEATLRKHFNVPTGVPSFDLLLLGVGPDGHIASLFPGHSLLKTTDRLITFITDSPKPPPKRITMTFPLINNARHSCFAICGAGKSEIVRKIFRDKEDLPAGKVTALNKVHWFLDEGAASQL